MGKSLLLIFSNHYGQLRTRSEQGHEIRQRAFLYLDFHLFFTYSVDTWSEPWLKVLRDPRFRGDDSVYRHSP
jgi:hypothetical protein